MTDVAIVNNEKTEIVVTEPTQKFVVAYAKFVEDKEDGIYMQGVFFGGIAYSRAEAEKIARECVNNTKGGTIMPRLIIPPEDSNAPVLTAMEIASKRFNQIEAQMFTAEDIYLHTQELQTRSRSTK